MNNIGKHVIIRSEHNIKFNINFVIVYYLIFYWTLWKFYYQNYKRKK